MSNLFSGLPAKLSDELTETLFQSSGVRIERIVSTGQISPPDFWYDQPETEFVAVLRGSATLEFSDCTPPKHLIPGDYAVIPPHQKHRVAETSETEATVWLAVFVR